MARSSGDIECLQVWCLTVKKSVCCHVSGGHRLFLFRRLLFLWSFGYMIMVVVVNSVDLLSRPAGC